MKRKNSEILSFCINSESAGGSGPHKPLPDCVLQFYVFTTFLKFVSRRPFDLTFLVCILNFVSPVLPRGVAFKSMSVLEFFVTVAAGMFESAVEVSNFNVPVQVAALLGSLMAHVARVYSVSLIVVSQPCDEPSQFTPILRLPSRLPFLNLSG